LCTLKYDRFPVLISGAFLVVGAFVMAHHELWRDEVQAWLLARDSSSAIDLLSLQKYEGHPALWQLLLMPLTRAFGTPIAMQVLHLLIATTTVYLFVRWSPFTMLQKVLLSFGYFPFYEYAIISRSYGLSLLLLTIFCCLYPHRKIHFVLIAVTLSLLCHTQVLSLIIVMVLFAALFLERLLAQVSPDVPRCDPLPFYAGCTVIALGIVTAVIQIMPPPDTGMFVGWQFGLSYDALSRIAKALVGAYLPVPTIGLNYWNNPLCLDRRLSPLNLFSSLTVFGYVVFVLAELRRNLTAMFVFGAGTAALLAFFCVKHPGYARHHGFLFICLVVSAWMAQGNAPAALVTQAASAVRDRWAHALSASLTLLFGIHVAAAGIASVQECRYRFSNSQEVAEYLHQHGHDESLLVGHSDCCASAILGSSAQKQFYYPEAKRWGSYIIWDKTRLTRITDQEIIDAARALSRPSGQHLLLVLSHELGEGLVRGNQMKELGNFDGAVVPDENFHLYLLD
jgi:hypothetical protein